MPEEKGQKSDQAKSDEIPQNSEDQSIYFGDILFGKGQAEQSEGEDLSLDADSLLVLDSYEGKPLKGLVFKGDLNKEGDRHYLESRILTGDVNDLIDSLPAERRNVWNDYQMKLARSGGFGTMEIRAARNREFPEIAKKIREAHAGLSMGDELHRKHEIKEELEKATDGNLIIFDSKSGAVSDVLQLNLSDGRSRFDTSKLPALKGRLRLDGRQEIVLDPKFKIQLEGRGSQSNFYATGAPSLTELDNYYARPGIGAPYNQLDARFPLGVHTDPLAQFFKIPRFNNERISEKVNFSRRLAMSGIDSLENPKVFEVKGDDLVNNLREQGVSTEELKRFGRDMDVFVESSRISPARKDSTLASVEKLINTDSTVGVTKEQRFRLAQQIINQGAYKNSIDQGGYPNCNVTDAEIVLSTNNIDNVAETVVDLALTGETRTAKGTTIKLDETSLQPASSRAVEYPDAENVRTHASQIFQLAAINLKYSRHNAKYGTNLRYVNAGGIDGDRGDYLMDISRTPPAKVYGLEKDGKPKLEAEEKKGKDGKILLTDELRPQMTEPIKDPGFTLPITLDVIEEFSGKSAAGLGLMHYSIMPIGTGNAVVDGFKMIYSSAGFNATATDSRIEGFRNVEQLEDILLNRKKQNKFPIILEAHTGDGFLREQVLEANGDTAGAGDEIVGGGHVVVITDYNPRSKKVSIDGTWGDSRDKLNDNSVSLSEVEGISKISDATRRRAKMKNEREAKEQIDRRTEYLAWCRAQKVTPYTKYPKTEELKSYRERLNPGK